MKKADICFCLKEFKDREIFYVNEERCEQITGHDGIYTTVLPSIDLFSSQEEADTRIILQLLWNHLIQMFFNYSYLLLKKYQNLSILTLAMTSRGCRFLWLHWRGHCLNPQRCNPWLTCSNKLWQHKLFLKKRENESFETCQKWWTPHISLRKIWNISHSQWWWLCKLGSFCLQALWETWPFKCGQGQIWHSKTKFQGKEKYFVKLQWSWLEPDASM